MTKRERLERLWAGEFGDRYVERNRGDGEDRGCLWLPLLAKFPVATALEVGCNIGLNLKWLRSAGTYSVGIDLNHGALRQLRAETPGGRVAVATGRSLPFRDAAFELVFTMGVLIHVDGAVLPDVMSEIVRCSARYVLCCEYFAAEPMDVPYRGIPGALYKRDFGSLYRRSAAGLQLRDTGELTREEFGDAMTFWLFEKS